MAVCLLRMAIERAVVAITRARLSRAYGRAIILIRSAGGAPDPLTTSFVFGQRLPPKTLDNRIAEVDNGFGIGASHAVDERIERHHCTLTSRLDATEHRAI